MYNKKSKFNAAFWRKEGYDTFERTYFFSKNYSAIPKNNRKEILKKDFEELTGINPNRVEQPEQIEKPVRIKSKKTKNTGDDE